MEKILKPELCRLHMLVSAYSKSRKEYFDYLTAMNEGKTDPTDLDIVEKCHLLHEELSVCSMELCDYIVSLSEKHSWEV